MQRMGPQDQTSTKTQKTLGMPTGALGVQYRTSGPIASINLKNDFFGMPTGADVCRIWELRNYGKHYTKNKKFKVC